jgi:hypothetical protein
MSTNDELRRALMLMQTQGGALQREFGHVYSGANTIAINVNYPQFPEETKKVRRGVKSLIDGALLVYLFAMWESHVPEDVSTWLTADERQRLDAYKHVRDSVAHKFNGERADFAGRRVAFEEEYPFDGIQWDRSTDTLDLSDSSASYGCFQFMEQLTKKLIARLYRNERP